MEQELVVALLLNLYKKKNTNEEIPKKFNILTIEDKLLILKKALKEKIKIEKLI